MPPQKLGVSFGRGFFFLFCDLWRVLNYLDLLKNCLRIVPILKEGVCGLLGWRSRGMFQNPLNSQISAWLLPEMSPLTPLGPRLTLLLLPLLPPSLPWFFTADPARSRIAFSPFSQQKWLRGWALGPGGLHLRPGSWLPSCVTLDKLVDLEASLLSGDKELVKKITRINPRGWARRGPVDGT